MRRRHFLFAGPAAVLAACGSDPDTGGPAGERADLGVLGAALQLEYQSVALYRIGTSLGGRSRDVLERILEHEEAHARGLRAAIVDLRGRAGGAARGHGFPRMRDERAFLEYARDFERRSAEAYATALPHLRSGRLRSTLASVLAAEAEHAAALAEELGGDPLGRVLPL